MEFPPSIFCTLPSCNNGHRFPLKLPPSPSPSPSSCVMVSPVTLSCTHKSCLSCIHKDKCGVCGAHAGVVRVDPLLQEICEWFISHEAFFFKACEGLVPLNGDAKPPANGISKTPSFTNPRALPVPKPRSPSSPALPSSPLTPSLQPSPRSSPLSSSPSSSSPNPLSPRLVLDHRPVTPPAPLAHATPSQFPPSHPSPPAHSLPFPPSQSSSSSPPLGAISFPRPVPVTARHTQNSAPELLRTSDGVDKPGRPERPPRENSAGGGVRAENSPSTPPFTPSPPLSSPSSSCSPSHPSPFRKLPRDPSQADPTFRPLSPPTSSSSPPSLPSRAPPQSDRPLSPPAPFAPPQRPPLPSTPSPSTRPPLSIDLKQQIQRGVPLGRGVGARVEEGRVLLHSQSVVFTRVRENNGTSSQSERPLAPPPPPKPKSKAEPPAPPPVPPLKPKKPAKLGLRPMSSPDLHKLIRGPKAEDFKQLFSSLGGFDPAMDLAPFGKSYEWATKPVDPSSLMWEDNANETAFARVDGWVNETRKGLSKIKLEDSDKDVLWYKTQLRDLDHVVYLGGETDNVVLVAVETSDEEHPQPYKAMIITKDGTERKWIQDSSSMKQRLKEIKKLGISVPKAKQMIHVKVPEIHDELLKWETRSMFTHYKFGILYCKEGQNTEEEIFGNEHGSKEFEDFLDCMGERVPLKGWTKYSGGLNTDAGLEGANSVYTVFENFEIMFHVSTLLPYNPVDQQQLARKRHIGNDIVAVVFMDGPCPPLKPTFIKTQFIYAFIIVQLLKPTPSGQKPKYRISVAARTGVRPFTPWLPREGIDFDNGPALREFLLMKLINAERAALMSGSFKDRMGKARQLFLNNLLDVYGK